MDNHAAPHLQKLLDFISLLHRFQQTRRQMFAVGEDRDENDAEHSYQLAMAAWYIAETEKLALDTSKILALALTHDLLEVYTGDFSAYRSIQTADHKKELEEKAAAELAQAFPEFPALRELIAEYEALATEESRFVYALDKLLPIINNYFDNGRSWKRSRISLEAMLRKKTENIAVSENITKYFKELIDIIKDQPDLF